jgi:hypothetical protein
VAAVFEGAEATLEAYAWVFEDQAAAGSLVEGFTDRADDCAHEVFADADTDGDGTLDAGQTDVQTAESWEGAGGWFGLRVHREVSGLGESEMVERRLVHSGGVVLLGVLRSDRVDADTEPLDVLLQEVQEGLA